MRPTLTSHPKLRRLCALLGVPTPHVIGYLELMWEVAYETGEPILGDALDVELAAQWPGDKGALVGALLSCGGNGHSGFLDLREDGRYEIHDLFDHAPEYVQKRASREAARRAKGKTISDLRAEAGRRGAESRWDGKRMARGEQLPSENGKRLASEWQIAITPAPTPINTNTNTKTKGKIAGKPGIPASPEEVQTYLDTLGERRFTGEQFHDYYATRGWVVGKTPMKDWRAAVRTWRRNEEANPRPIKARGQVDTRVGAAPPATPGSCQECGKISGKGTLCRECFLLLGGSQADADGYYGGRNE